MSTQKIVDPNIYTKTYYMTDSEGWKEYIAGLDSVMHPKYKMALKIAKAASGHTALDIGCGRGELLYYCAKKQINITGIDYSKIAVSIAQETISELPKQYRKFATAQLGDIGTVSFDKQFDIIFMLDVVEHMYDWQLVTAFKKINALLVNGGKLIIITPNYLYEKYLLPLKCILNIPFNFIKWPLRIARKKYKPKSFKEFLSKVFKIGAHKGELLQQMHINVSTPLKLKELLFEFDTSIRCYDHSLNPISLTTKRWLGRQIIAVAKKRVSRWEPQQSGIVTPLSVVILTKNEENNIKDCILSVKDWAEEIIVIDDNSTDNTVHIAKELGAKVYIRSMDVEGRHRNWAYQKTAHAWVFSLDADERPTEELKKEIAYIIQKNEHCCYDIPFRTFIGDHWIRWGGWYPGPKVKLFQKNKFKYEEVEVHPRIIIDGTCGHLQSDVIHYSYKDWGDFLNKTNKQTTFEAVKWYKLSLENPKKAARKMNLLHALWRTLDRFLRSFFAKKGYRDGFTGFMVAYFSSLYQILSYAKYRKLVKRKNIHKVSP